MSLWLIVGFTAACATKPSSGEGTTSVSSPAVEAPTSSAIGLAGYVDVLDYAASAATREATDVAAWKVTPQSTVAGAMSVDVVGLNSAGVPVFAASAQYLSPLSPQARLAFVATQPVSGTYAVNEANDVTDEASPPAVAAFFAAVRRDILIPSKMPNTNDVRLKTAIR